MEKKSEIRILIADDHQMLLDGLRSLLSIEENIHIVGEAINGHQVLDILGYDPVDVAVIDIAMPGMDGHQTVLEIKQKHPQTKVIILSLHKEEDIIRKFMDAGVSGYVIKDRGSEELVKAINSVASGEDYWDSEAVKILVKSERNKTNNAIGGAPLSPREKEVLCLIGNGLTTKKTAEALFIADSTVETHRKNILSKLGCDTSKQLIINFQNNKYKHLL
jgi:two-component system nitrate/nitrite response regulator NarL